MPDVAIAPLPAKQTKRTRGESHPDEVIRDYAQRYRLTASDLEQRQVMDLLDSKINSDIYVAQQTKRIAALEQKVAGLLGFVEKAALLLGKKRTKETK